MANSTFTGSVAGYASGTQPGLVSTTAQTFAGKKTLDGGALIKGDTSGVAIAAGYVGEFISSTSVNTSIAVSASNLVATSIRRLTFVNQGIYMITGNVGVSVAPTGALGRFRAYTSASASVTVYGLANDLWITTSGVVGTNAINGWVFVSAANQTVDIVADTLSGSLTGGPYSITATWSAVRID